MHTFAVVWVHVIKFSISTTRPKIKSTGPSKCLKNGNLSKTRKHTWGIAGLWFRVTSILPFNNSEFSNFNLQLI